MAPLSPYGPALYYDGQGPNLNTIDSLEWTVHMHRTASLINMTKV